ncbi:MAG: tetratricopeptide repeat protein [Candidatus Riflebacteria bacterium]|nr:tetratricopeptide repeat protein [Candidatus Riflebacteria bacterium]
MLSKNFFIVLFILFINFSCVYANISGLNDNSGKNPFDVLEKYYSEQEYDKAIALSRKCLEKAPKEHPQRQRAYDIMILSIEGNARRKAVQEKTETAKEAKKNSDADIAEGTTYLVNKMYSEARTRFQRAIRKYPGDAETYYLLGYCEKMMGNRSDAYLAFKECVKKNPAHPRALFNLSEMSYSQKNFEEAEDFSEKLSRVIAQRLAELKQELYQQKRAELNDKAMTTARKMAALKKNLAQAQYLLGILSLRKGDFKNARKVLLLAAKLDSEPMETYYHLGRVNLQLKQYNESAQAFEKAILLGENVFRELKLNAKKLLDQGKSDEAVAEESKAREIGRRLAMSWLGISIASLKVSDVSSSFDAVNKALDYQSDLRQARYAKAMLFEKIRDFPSAQREIRELLKSAPPNSEEAKTAVAALKSMLSRSIDMTSVKKTFPGTLASARERSATLVDRRLKEMPGLEGRKSESEWEELFPVMREIRELIDIGNIPEAVVKLKALRGHHPHLVQIHSILGRLYSEQGRLTDALSSFNDALRLDPNNAEALANQAYISVLKGKDIDLALKNAQRAVEMQPARSEFRHTLGWIWFKKGELDNSIEHLSEAVKLNPGYLLARYNLGLAYYLTGNFPSALKAFETVITSKPDHVKAVLFRGITLAKMGKIPEALEVLDNLKKSLPQKEVMFSIVSDLQNKFKIASERNTDIPIPDIKHPAPIAKLLKKAREHRQNFLVSRAKELYLKCQKLNPSAFEPYYELGQMYADEGLYQPAMRVWTTALKINPNHYLLQFNMGIMAHKTGRREEAMRAFVAAQALNPKDPEPPYYLGLIAYEDGRFESAESHSLASLRIKGRHLKALSLLGMARIRLKRFRPARDAFEKVYTIAPAESSIRRLARKKLWEISRLAEPMRSPSYEDAMRQKELMLQNSDNDKNGERLRREIVDGRKAQPIRWARLTANEKIQVRKSLESFPAALPPSESASDASSARFTSSQMSSSEKSALLNQIKSFRVIDKVYPPPPPTMSSKYDIRNRPKTRQPDPSDDNLKKGIEAATKGFLSQALGEFEKAFSSSPKNLDVLLNLGYLHTIMGNFKNAFDYFGQAAVYHPNHPFGKQGLGNLYWLGGHPTEAVEQWKKTGPAFKTDKDFHLYAKSEAAWKRVLDSSPQEIEAHSQLGMIYMFTGRLPEALSEFAAVRTLAPERVEHIFYQIQTYVMLYSTSNVTSYKNQARAKLAELETASPDFPHLKSVKAYIEKL